MTNGTGKTTNRRLDRIAGWLAVLTATAGLAPAAALSTGQALAAPHPAAARGQVAAGVISTIAGGVGGPGRATRLSLFGPCGVASSAGSVYVGDGLALRKINVRTDLLTTPAGNGISGPIFDGLLASRASIDTCGVAFDQAGNAVLPNPLENVIELLAASTGTFYGKAMTAGHIYTVAGNGSNGFSGDGGPALQAEFADPIGISVDGAGNLIIADTGNDRVRVVAAATGTFYGKAMTAGDVYTVAGNGGTVLGDGGPATKARLFDPDDVSVDGAGNLLIADRLDQRIRVVAATSGTFYGQAMTAGDIYTVAGNGNQGFSGDGGPATKAALQNPTSVAPDGTGNLIITDSFNNRIRVVAVATGTFYGRLMTAGDIYTVAGDGILGFSGDGGPATKAELSDPFAAGPDGMGNLVIADTFNHRLRVVPVASGTFYGQPMTAGHIYTVAGNGTATFSGDGGPATRAQLDKPGGVTVDRAGNWVIADTSNNRIRVVARATGTFYGVSMTAGAIYTVAGDGTEGFSGDGGPATKAGLDQPEGVRVDRAGNLVFADTDSNRVRVVAETTGTFYGQPMTAGDIYTVAGNGGTGHGGDGGPATNAGIKDPEGVAPDHSGNLVIAGGYGNNRVRVVAETTGTFYGRQMTAGNIYTLAGGGIDFNDGIPATSAELQDPRAVAVDHAGNVLISEMIGWRVRVVAASTGTFYGQQMTVGNIYTVAGGGNEGGDGIPATDAHLPRPAGVAVDGVGNLLICAFHDSRIRVVAAATGTFYGKAMIAGDIYTVAGGGKGRVEDGGPATGARLLRPEGVAAGPAGSIVIADTGNGLIRTVTG